MFVVVQHVHFNRRGNLYICKVLSGFYQVYGTIRVSKIYLKDIYVEILWILIFFVVLPWIIEECYGNL